MTSSSGYGYQIGQCRLHIDEKKTAEFYKDLPKIAENCGCANCRYFEEEIVNKDIRFFNLLRKMRVDLTRQPKIHPDGLSWFGDTEKYKQGYMGNYFVYGTILKTQLKSKVINENGDVESVHFFETEEDSTIQYGITQIDVEKLNFQFALQCEKK